MRTVLCFGDSNTYGQIPGRGPLDRFGWDQRWPGVMQAELGPGWHIIEEGLSGRTTVRDDPIEGEHKNGRRYLKPCLQSHAPVDLVILMLGTNDLKRRFSQPASEVAMGIGCLVHDTKELMPGRGGHVPEIMIVAPPPMLEDLREWASIFDGAPEKSHRLGLEFEVMADSLEVHFFDAATVCACDPADGFHLGASAHAALGQALAREVQAIGWPAD
ncbi:SGNH/GDSL hydrolase family protein [Rhodobacter sp. KR11]|uniref:SGNH/GDSL hydrolase family protein n=1 Tax=Rhodobacter sp. KR11 TaxID=2974588 RepID=UPI002221BBE5|nr:SGNH/GDSL hydrolase family protein [Rhodobacter sp. KR11]MCW1920527.1 SGNH/GDSL hydrolase family protein [Rhodobacter sp. KR11]